MTSFINNKIISHMNIINVTLVKCTHVILSPIFVTYICIFLPSGNLLLHIKNNVAILLAVINIRNTSSCQSSLGSVEAGFLSKSYLSEDWSCPPKTGNIQC